MYWKKWFKKNWWIVLLPIIVPAGIIILKYINKISEIREIIENEKFQKPLLTTALPTKQKGDIIFLNRCFDCGKSDSPLFWLLTELGGKKFCGECYRVYYKLVLETNY